MPQIMKIKPLFILYPSAAILLTNTTWEGIQLRAEWSGPDTCIAARAEDAETILGSSCKTKLHCVCMLGSRKKSVLACTYIIRAGRQADPANK